MTDADEYCHWCGRVECDDPAACEGSLAWERSVLCERCRQPSGVHPMTLYANTATTVVCSACLRDG